MASFRTGKFNKEAIDERLAKPSSRKALLQISRRVCPEISAEVDIRNIEEGDWRDIPGVMQAVWAGVSRGICDAGSYPHAVDDSAEVQCGPYGRVSEREVGDSYIQGLSAGETEFHGASFLGPRLLRQYSGSG